MALKKDQKGKILKVKVRKPTGARKLLKVAAIKVSYNDCEYFLASLDAKTLFNMSAVTRAEEDPEEGYQRILGKKRAGKIAEYLNGGHVIPGALILSANEQKPRYDEDKRELTLSNGAASFLVIDGQHRLYGASQADVHVELPVCIFFGLEKAEEVQYFLDVNGYQIGVPKTLRLELQKFTAEEDSEEYILKALFDELDQNPTSPLSGKMSRAKSVSGKLSHVAFQNGIKPLLNKAPFNTFTLEQKKKVLTNFLQALESIVTDIFGDNKKISNAAFFQALMAAFVDICNVTMTNSGGYKKSAFEDTLDSLEEINWDTHTGTNKAAINAMTSDVVMAVSEQIQIQDDIF